MKDSGILLLLFLAVVVLWGVSAFLALGMGWVVLGGIIGGFALLGSWVLVIGLCSFVDN